MKRLMMMALCGWLILVSEGHGAGGVIEVYSAGNTDLDVFVESIHVLVGAEDSVIPDPKQHRVVVHTSPATHRAIAAMAKTLVRPVQNIRVDVSIRDRVTDDRTSIGVSGGGGDVRKRIRLQPWLSSTKTEARSSALQSLLVASGREAVLRVGESVPYLEWLEVYGLRGGSIRQRVAWQDVGSFLVVQPTVLDTDGSIRVRLTPVLQGQVGGRPHQVRFAELATEVTVRDGHRIDLGGLNTDREFYSRFLVGMDRSQTARQLDVELTPTILDAGGGGVRP